MIIFRATEPTDLKGNTFIKAAVLLTIGLFLISAPAPDAGVIEEMTSNLIAIAKNPAMEP
jgi:hypothetical protein